MKIIGGTSSRPNIKYKKKKKKKIIGLLKVSILLIATLYIYLNLQVFSSRQNNNGHDGSSSQHQQASSKEDNKVTSSSSSSSSSLTTTTSRIQQQQQQPNRNQQKPEKLQILLDRIYIQTNHTYTYNNDNDNDGNIKNLWDISNYIPQWMKGTYVQFHYILLYL